MIGLGFYCNHNPTLGGVLAFIFFIGTTGFLANGANYGIPAIICPSAIGTVSGMVGAAGNVGGLMYLGIFLAVPGVRARRTLGTKFWIAGVVNAGAVLPFFHLLTAKNTIYFGWIQNSPLPQAYFNSSVLNKVRQNPITLRVKER